MFSTTEELLAALRTLQGDAEERDRLAANAYRGYCEHWTESVVLPRYLDVVRLAAERRGHHAVADLLPAPSTELAPSHEPGARR